MRLPVAKAQAPSKAPDNEFNTRAKLITNFAPCCAVGSVLEGQGVGPPAPRIWNQPKILHMFPFSARPREPAVMKAQQDPHCSSKAFTFAPTVDCVG